MGKQPGATLLCQRKGGGKVASAGTEIKNIKPSPKSTAGGSFSRACNSPVSDGTWQAGKGAFLSKVTKPGMAGKWRLGGWFGIAGKAPMPAWLWQPFQFVEPTELWIKDLGARRGNGLQPCQSGRLLEQYRHKPAFGQPQQQQPQQPQQQHRLPCRLPCECIKEWIFLEQFNEWKRVLVQRGYLSVAS